MVLKTLKIIFYSIFLNVFYKLISNALLSWTVKNFLLTEVAINYSSSVLIGLHFILTPVFLWGSLRLSGLKSNSYVLKLVNCFLASIMVFLSMMLLMLSFYCVGGLMVIDVFILYLVMLFFSFFSSLAIAAFK